MGVGPRLGAERSRHRRCLARARDQEHDLTTEGQSRQGHGDPRHERLQTGLLDADGQAGALVQRRLIREQRRQVPVRAEAEQDELEPARSAARSSCS